MTCPATHPENALAVAATPGETPLSPAAARALAEAEARRQAASGPTPAVELGGRDGPDPVRFGDWEKKGLAVDF